MIPTRIGLRSDKKVEHKPACSCLSIHSVGQPQGCLSKPAELIASTLVCKKSVDHHKMISRMNAEPVPQSKVHEGGTQADCQYSRQRSQSMRRETVRMH
jgi:hypothetical protein